MAAKEDLPLSVGRAFESINALPDALAGAQADKYDENEPLMQGHLLTWGCQVRLRRYSCG